jgi:hypothetical protein
LLCRSQYKLGNANENAVNKLVSQKRGRRGKKRDEKKEEPKETEFPEDDN